MFYYYVLYFILLVIAPLTAWMYPVAKGVDVNRPTQLAFLWLSVYNSLPSALRDNRLSQNQRPRKLRKRGTVDASRRGGF